MSKERNSRRRAGPKPVPDAPPVSQTEGAGGISYEAAARASNELLWQFVLNTPAAVAMFDRDMRYLLASKRWMEDYRLGDRSIIGLSHYEVFPDIPQRWKDAQQRAVAGSIERCEEDRWERPDSTVEWMRWELQPWRDQRGEVGGILEGWITFGKAGLRYVDAREYPLFADGQVEYAVVLIRDMTDAVPTIPAGRNGSCGPGEPRPRAIHHQGTGRGPWREDLGGERGGKGQHLQLRVAGEAELLSKLRALSM